MREEPRQGRWYNDYSSRVKNQVEAVHFAVLATYFLISESIQTDCGTNPASSTGNSSVVKRAAYEAERNDWYYTSIPPWRFQVQVQLLKHCGYYMYHVKGKKVKFSRYRPAVAQRVGRDIAVLFHDDHGTRRG